jgi:hypothetical protein
MRPVTLLLLLSLGVITAAACANSAPPANQPPGGPNCTTEAKICPDGSGVGRTGPNCEFAPCPG